MKCGDMYTDCRFDLKRFGTNYASARSCAKQNSRGAIECFWLSRGKMKVSQYGELVFVDVAKLVPICKRAVTAKLKLTIKIGHIEVQRESLFVNHRAIKLWRNALQMESQPGVPRELRAL